jgi:hypothetical protein
MGGYGDWGRYEMGSRVSKFQARRLSEEPNRKWSYSGFDDRVARRYVLQRAVELGVSRQQFADVEPLRCEFRDRPSIERLGKKYQWIAMHEFLGYLSDHFHMTPEWEGDPPRYESANQLSLPDLLDPFSWKPDNPEARKKWEFIRKAAPWWASYPHLFPRVLTSEQREKRVAARDIIEPTLLLRTSHETHDWITLSGYFRWEEPKPCYQSKQLGVRQGQHLWLFNSYAVPEKLLSLFITKMREPVLGGNMRPPEPDFRSEILTLRNYPNIAPEMAEECTQTFAGTPGTWFTTCNYSDKQEHERSLSGFIPSPQLSKILKLAWTQSGLDFCALEPSQPVVCDVRDGELHACLCQAEPLLIAFKKRKLRLVWRLFGWKWIGGDKGLQREYWALYSVDALGKAICIGGGTWIAEPNPKSESLPWTVNGHGASGGRGSKRSRPKTT